MIRMRKFLQNDRNRYRILIMLILAAGIAVKLIKFRVLMDQTQSDEMGIGYDAWCLANYGVDRHGLSWPVYFMNFFNGQSALYTYSLVPVIKFLGYSRTAIRLPALLYSIAAGVFATLLTGELIPDDTGEKRLKAQAVVAFLYAVSPYTFMASRIALDCNLMFSMGTVFLYFLVVAYKSRNNALYFFAGLFAGLTLYTYAIAYIVLPVTLLLSIIYMIRQKRVSIVNVILFVIPLGILATPLILVQIVNYFELETMHLGIFTITRLVEYRVGELGFNNFFSGIWQGLWSALWHDHIHYNTNKYFFTFYPMSVPFFFYGLYVLVRRNISKKDGKEAEPFLLFWFVGELIAAGLMTNPNTNRMNGIMIAVMYVITVGIIEVIQRIQGKAQKVFTISLFAVYTVYFAVFMYAYVTVIGFDRSTESSMCPEAIEYVRSDPNLADRVVASNIPPMTYPATALPSPDKIDADSNYKDEEHYTYYVNYGYETLRDYFFNVGGYDQIYLVYLPTEDDQLFFNEYGATVKQFGYSFYLYYWE